MPAPDHPGPQEAGMFLRRYTRNKDGKTHTYYALVERRVPRPGRASTWLPTSAN